MAAAMLGVHTSSLGAPQEHTQSGGATAAAPAPFLLGTDPVSGEKLGSGAVSLTYQGRELRFTSKTNAERFQRDLATYLPKIDAEIVRTQLPTYPLQTCAVSAEKLGGMGDPINYVHLNRLVRFCCSSCKDEFLKDPQAHLKKIDAAVIAQQARDYPLKTCVVSGEELGGMGKPVDAGLGTRLVRLCCNGCVKELAKEPAKHLEKVSAARPAAATK